MNVEDMASQEVPRAAAGRTAGHEALGPKGVAKPRVLRTVAEMRTARKQIGSLGFVPTMGYLHEGHLALVRQARVENEAVAVSIFVNPTQFGPNEDFAKYPRDLVHDLRLLESEGVDIVFVPEVAEMYPPRFDVTIDVGGVSVPLEGAHRPGHFRGVATVVAKLFNIVAPTCAYFGQKDAQQVRVIQKMVADLAFDLEVVVVPTVREADGLAMSSRNVYLSPAERDAALVLWRSLCLARARFDAGERDANLLKREMERTITAEQRARIDYVSIASADTLAELTQLDQPALVSLAVHIGNTRLIDNVLLGDNDQRNGG